MRVAPSNGANYSCSNELHLFVVHLAQRRSQVPGWNIVE